MNLQNRRKDLRYLFSLVMAAINCRSVIGVIDIIPTVAVRWMRPTSAVRTATSDQRPGVRRSS